jgi:hypothetical protein
VSTALQAGYRHIDTPQMYGNEAEAGEAIARPGLDRGEVFVTSKLGNDAHEPGDARRAIGETLKALGTRPADLFLIHWPLPGRYGGDFTATWRVPEEACREGRARPDRGRGLAAATRTSSTAASPARAVRDARQAPETASTVAPPCPSGRPVALSPRGGTAIRRALTSIVVARISAGMTVLGCLSTRRLVRASRNLRSGWHRSIKISYRRWSWLDAGAAVGASLGCLPRV